MVTRTIRGLIYSGTETGVIEDGVTQAGVTEGGVLKKTEREKTGVVWARVTQQAGKGEEG